MNNIVQLGCLFSKFPRLFVDFLSTIISIFYRVVKNEKSLVNLILQSQMTRSALTISFQVINVWLCRDSTDFFTAYLSGRPINVWLCRDFNFHTEQLSAENRPPFRRIQTGLLCRARSNIFMREDHDDLLSKNCFALKAPVVNLWKLIHFLMGPYWNTFVKQIKFAFSFFYLYLFVQRKYAKKQPSKKLQSSRKSKVFPLLRNQ